MRIDNDVDDSLPRRGQSFGAGGGMPRYGGEVLFQSTSGNNLTPCASPRVYFV